MANAVAFGLHLAEIDTEILGASTNGGGCEDGLISPPACGRGRGRACFDGNRGGTFDRPSPSHSRTREGECLRDRTLLGTRRPCNAVLLHQRNNRRPSAN